MPPRPRNKDHPGLQEIVRTGGSEPGATNFVQVIIDAIPDPVFIIDTDFTVTAMNKAARQADGAQPAPRPDNKCYTLMEQIGATCDDPGRPCSLRSGKGCLHLQDRTSADGETRPVEIRMTPLLD